LKSLRLSKNPELCNSTNSSFNTFTFFVI